MRKLWLTLAVFGCWGWWGPQASQAQQLMPNLQPEIVVIDYQTPEAKPAEAKPAAPATYCAAPCSSQPSLCLPRFSLHSSWCRCAQPCPTPCHVHPVRPLFCREAAACPSHIGLCRVSCAPCPANCHDACRPSLLDRLHGLFHRDCCASACIVTHTPAAPQPTPEKAPLPKPVD